MALQPAVIYPALRAANPVAPAQLNGWPTCGRWWQETEVPYEVSTESKGTGVIVSFSGIVSGPEVLDLNQRLNDEESFAQCRYQVWDFSKATRLDLTVDDLRTISMQDMAASAVNPTLNIAIVGEPAFFGNRDRIFLIFEEVWTAFRPKFFTDFETARAWASSGEHNS